MGYWVLAGDDVNGVLALDRESLQEFLKELTHSDRQGMQITLFDLDDLNAIISATEARILI